MARWSVLSLGVVLLWTTTALWGRQSQQPAPVFRSRVDLLQLDVTVLDKNGRPVRGLAKDDFIVLEDKKPQTIQGFTPVDLPEAAANAPTWATSVPDDVFSNDSHSQRVFVIVIDDARGVGYLPTMIESAAFFITSLGPADLTALVFTNNTRANQNLTTDHARLIKALETSPPDGGGILVAKRGSMMDPCLGEKSSVGTIQGVVNSLAQIPDRRKAVVYFGYSLPWPLEPDRCFTYARWRETFAAAQQSHVTINPVASVPWQTDGVKGGTDVFRTIAENTGGRSVIAGSDFEAGIRQILLENSSYYLMAYQPSNEVEDGTFRRISVTVKGRPDLDVRTRRSYWAPKRPKTEAAVPAPPEVAALAGLLPVSDLDLRATAAAFGVAGTSKAIVSVAVSVTQPPLGARTPEQIELLVKAFTADGDERASQTDTIALTIPAARPESPNSRYEALTRIELPTAGKYELRLSAHSAVTNTRGSVYLDVEVPDFAREVVSLSGVVFDAALPGWPVAPPRAFRDVMPVTPTTVRTFSASDLVTAFVRVYQGGRNAVTGVPIVVTVRSAAGETVFSLRETVPANRFSAQRAADYQLPLRLTTLAAGDYALMFTATIGQVTASRAVRFQVRSGR